MMHMLTLINVGMADAALAAWDSKYFYKIWRPVTAIRESDVGTGPSNLGDGNSSTIGNPAWKPLGAPASNLSSGIPFSPPFPGYVSGHGTFGGTIFSMLRRVFGKDDIPFTFVSDEFNGITKDSQGNVRPYKPRTFTGFSQAEEENGQSRIYLGIHFNQDKTEAIKMGRKVGDYVYDHLYQPI